MTATDATRALVNIVQSAAERNLFWCAIDLDTTEGVGAVTLHNGTFDDDCLTKDQPVQLPAGVIDAANVLMTRGRVTLPSGHIARFTSRPSTAGRHSIGARIWAANPDDSAPAAIDEVAAA